MGKMPKIMPKYDVINIFKYNTSVRLWKLLPRYINFNMDYNINTHPWVLTIQFVLSAFLELKWKWNIINTIGELFGPHTKYQLEMGKLLLVPQPSLQNDAGIKWFNFGHYFFDPKITGFFPVRTFFSFKNIKIR